MPEIQKRILALDAGEVRIGVAVSDPLLISARSLDAIAARNFERAAREINSLVEKYDAGLVIIGLPLKLDGGDSPQTTKVRAFAADLEKTLPVPVQLHDERFTSKISRDVLLSADVSRKKQKKAIDSLSAAVLLQSYLDSRSRRES